MISGRKPGIRFVLAEGELGEVYDVKAHLGEEIIAEIEEIVGVPCKYTRIEKGIVPCDEKELNMNKWYDDICVKATPLQPLPKYTPVDHSMTRYFTFKEHREMQAWRNQLKRREAMAAEFWKRQGKWTQVWTEIDEAIWKILRDWKAEVLDKLHPEQVDPKALLKKLSNIVNKPGQLISEDLNHISKSWKKQSLVFNEIFCRISTQWPQLP
jgi:hypothetical protein